MSKCLCPPPPSASWPSHPMDRGHWERLGHHCVEAASVQWWGRHLGIPCWEGNWCVCSNSFFRWPEGLWCWSFIFWSQVLAGEKDWTRSTEFRCKELTYTVTGLTEGADYYIRVIAVNDAGPGAPGVTEPVTVAEPQGRDTLIVVTETLLHLSFIYFCLIPFYPIWLLLSSTYFRVSCCRIWCFCEERRYHQSWRVAEASCHGDRSTPARNQMGQRWSWNRQRADDCGDWGQEQHSVHQKGCESRSRNVPDLWHQQQRHQDRRNQSGCYGSVSNHQQLPNLWKNISDDFLRILKN